MAAPTVDVAGADDDYSSTDPYDTLDIPTPPKRGQVEMSSLKPPRHLLDDGSSDDGYPTPPLTKNLLEEDVTEGSD